MREYLQLEIKDIKPKNTLSLTRLINQDIMQKSNQNNCQNLTKLITKIWQCINEHKNGNIWMTNKQMRKSKIMEINQLNIIANYHINLEFYLGIF